MHSPKNNRKETSRTFRKLIGVSPLLILVGLFLVATATNQVTEWLGVLFSLVGVLWLVHAYGMLVVSRLRHTK